MSSDPELPSDAEIISALVGARLVAAADAVHLERHPQNFRHRNGRRRITARVRSDHRTLFHLTVGKALAQLHQQTEAFAKAQPAIACKPLFFGRTASFDFLAQEYFGQGNLEDGWLQKRIDDRGWQAGAMAIKAQLRAGSQPASQPDVMEEVNTLEQRLLALGSSSLLDRRRLRSEVFPLIRAGAAAGPRRATWTNGDFTTRNILFDGNGGFRLVDCEFAGTTYFEEIDWFRLQHFSTMPPTVNLSELSGIAKWPEWLEVLCWLQHALKLSEISVPDVIELDFRTIAGHLARLLQPCNKSS